MAFQKAAGWNNLPNGNFSPVIFSQKVQVAFRKENMATAITNSDYFGEISGYGDSVKIIKEPDIDIIDYARGQRLEPQDIDDEEFTLVIDQANAFSFQMDDIEVAHSHVDWMSMASDRAAYNLMDQMDMEVLGYMSGYKQSAIGSRADTVNDVVNGTKAISTAGSDELLASMKLKKGDFTNITTASAGDHSIPLGVRLPGATAQPTTYATAMMVLNRMKTKLDRQQVAKDGRFVVIDPDFEEILRDEHSAFLNADWGQAGALRSGEKPVQIAGFTVYCSNNLPEIGTGPTTSGTANQNTNYGVLVAGHTSAVATAQQMNKVEQARDPFAFVDIVKGMNLYGRKILRPEAIVTAKWNVA